jgi:hypothetical protein
MKNTSDVNKFSDFLSFDTRDINQQKREKIYDLTTTTTTATTTTAAAEIQKFVAKKTRKKSFVQISLAVLCHVLEMALLREKVVLKKIKLLNETKN